MVCQQERTKVAVAEFIFNIVRTEDIHRFIQRIGGVSHVNLSAVPKCNHKANPLRVLFSFIIIYEIVIFKIGELFLFFRGNGRFCIEFVEKSL